MSQDLLSGHSLSSDRINSHLLLKQESLLLCKELIDPLLSNSVKVFVINEHVHVLISNKISKIVVGVLNELLVMVDMFQPKT